MEVHEPEEPPKQLISAVTGQPFGPRVHYISEKKEDESSDDEPESEIDEEIKYFEEEAPEVPTEFWHIQKLIRYMKAGNQTATMVAVCLLKDYDLANQVIYFFFCYIIIILVININFLIVNITNINI